MNTGLELRVNKYLGGITSMRGVLANIWTACESGNQEQDPKRDVGHFLSRNQVWLGIA